MRSETRRPHRRGQPLLTMRVGNAQLPKKFQALKKHRAHVRWAAVAIGLLVVAALAAGFLFFAQTTGSFARPLPWKKASPCFRLKI